MPVDGGPTFRSTSPQGKNEQAFQMELVVVVSEQKPVGSDRLQ